MGFLRNGVWTEATPRGGGLGWNFQTGIPSGSLSGGSYSWGKVTRVSCFEKEKKGQTPRAVSHIPEEGREQGSRLFQADTPSPLHSQHILQLF